MSEVGQIVNKPDQRKHKTASKIKLQNCVKESLSFIWHLSLKLENLTNIEKVPKKPLRLNIETSHHKENLDALARRVTRNDDKRPKLTIWRPWKGTKITNERRLPSLPSIRSHKYLLKLKVEKQIIIWKCV